MLQTIKSCNNMMVSPHWMATQAGIDIMRNGGNAIEAMISSAAVISVVYPHMNSLGGDNFWLMNTFDHKCSSTKNYRPPMSSYEGIQQK